MKMKKFAIPFLLFGLVLTVLPVQAIPRQQEKTNPVIIPPAVKAVLEQAVQTSESRQDIPFEFYRHIFLPTTTENLHNIFLFNVKNADLGFAPMVSTEVDLQAADDQSSFQETAAKMQARGNAFLQFRNKADKAIVKEVYVPYNFQIEGATYKAEESVMCSVGYPRRRLHSRHGSDLHRSAENRHRLPGFHFTQSPEFHRQPGHHICLFRERHQKDAGA